MNLENPGDHLTKSSRTTPRKCRIATLHSVSAKTGERVTNIEQQFQNYLNAVIRWFRKLFGQFYIFRLDDIVENKFGLKGVVKYS